MGWYFRIMETEAKSHSARLPANGADQPRMAKPWVKNLLAGQGFDLPADKQFWWGVHLAA
jgi:hypothetical protein